MNKTIKICLGVILGALGLSSCSVQTSLVKRHYNSGYYVDRSEKPYDADAREQAKPVAHSKSTVATLPKKEDPGAGTEIVLAPAIHQLARLHKAGSAVGSQTTATGATKPEVNTQTASATQSPLNFTHKLVDVKHLNGEGEREGLSLFWVVIIILLILWLFGLLGGGWGLGILINLLLLFALILLILWLLRIV
ncbi:MAG: hypothetical protein ACHQRM_03865 [Bacteroidia bacterium]